MFGFKRKKKVEKKTEEVELTAEEKALYKQKVDRLQSKIDSATNEEKPDLYDEMGGILQKLNDTDGAIVAFEASLKSKERYGAAYNALLTLYDGKRKEAAEAKNDKQIQKWVTKTDALLAMSKRVMRSSMV